MANIENNQTECHHCFAIISRENKNNHEQNCSRNPQGLDRPNLVERPNWVFPAFFVMLALNAAMLASILYSNLRNDASPLDRNIDKQIELNVIDKFENLINDKIDIIFTEKFEQNINEKIRTKNMKQFEQIKTQLTDPLEQKIYEEIQTNNNELSERIHKAIENEIEQIKLNCVNPLEQKLYEQFRIKNTEQFETFKSELDPLGQKHSSEILSKDTEQFEKIRTQLIVPFENKVYKKISATNIEQSLQINQSVLNQIKQIKDLISLLEQKIYQEISAIKNAENISEIVNEMETLRRKGNDLENEFKDQKQVSLELQKIIESRASDRKQSEVVRILTLITDLKNDFLKLQIDLVKKNSELERLFTDQNEKFQVGGDFYGYQFVEIQNGFDSQLRWQNYFIFFMFCWVYFKYLLYSVFEAKIRFMQSRLIARLGLNRTTFDVAFLHIYNVCYDVKPAMLNMYVVKVPKYDIMKRYYNTP